MTPRKSTPLAIRRGMTLAERLSIDVHRAGPDDCWPWTGPRNRWGYGRQSRGGREILMHRVAYELEHGPIPEGMVVRHSCDNPPCCNPRHLLIGSAADNREDCVSRMRHTFGVACPSAVLTPATVLEARRRRRGGLSYRKLAERYGVTEATIRKAVLGISWKQVADHETKHLAGGAA